MVGNFREGINRGGTFRGEFSGGEIAGHRNNNVVFIVIIKDSECMSRFCTFFTTSPDDLQRQSRTSYGVHENLTLSLSLACNHFDRNKYLIHLLEILYVKQTNKNQRIFIDKRT